MLGSSASGSRGRSRQKVLLFHGGIGSGKTTALLSLAGALRRSGEEVAGVAAPAVIFAGRRIGYDLIDVASGERREFLRLAAASRDRGKTVVGNFSLVPGGLEFGVASLQSRLSGSLRIVILDEVGPWELSGGGWAETIDRFLLPAGIPMIWAVRTGLVTPVIRRWSFQSPEIVALADLQGDELPARVGAWLQEFH